LNHSHLESLEKDLITTKYLISLSQKDEYIIDVSLLATIQAFEKSL
jgi:hypothetical protein